MKHRLWIVLVLAVIEAGWLAFDGMHALITGDYVTPQTGRFAGQLGPWAQVVEAIGIAPRSTPMYFIHFGLGVGWLGVAGAFALARPWARHGMLVGAVAALWYLPFGTLLSAVQIILLSTPVLRNPGPIPRSTSPDP